MCTLSAYLQTWRLKLSHTKTVTTAFHLTNREAKRELKFYNNDRLLPFCPTPSYHGVKLDRLLTFRHHLVALRKKISSRVTLLRQLMGSGWGAGAKTLRIATLFPVYSTAEYCTPEWCRSAHTSLIDSVLNDAFCIVTGCLPFTSTDHNHNIISKHIVHGGSLFTSSVSLFIIIANRNELNADPWCNPTLTLKLSVVLLHTSPLFRFPRIYPVQVAHTFPLLLIFSYSITALPAEPCRKLSLGPRIHNVALFDLPCTFPSTFLKLAKDKIQNYFF